MNIQQNLTTVNRTIYSNRKIEYIVIHYCGAIGWAAGVANYFKSVNRSASAHYVVDEDEIWQIVLDKDASWHCGDSGKGTHKGKCTNANSIGIEMCVKNPNGNVNSVQANAGWYFEPQTLLNTFELVRELMAKHNIPIENVIRHYDVTAKWCPAPFVNGQLGWHTDFIGKLIEPISNEPSDWAKEAIEWARLNGVSDGTRPHDMATREEMVTMLWRALK